MKIAGNNSYKFIEYLHCWDIVMQKDLIYIRIINDIFICYSNKLTFRALSSWSRFFSRP